MQSLFEMRKSSVVASLVLAAGLVAVVGFALGRRVEQADAKEQFTSQAARLDALQRAVAKLAERDDARLVGTSGIAKPAVQTTAPLDAALVDTIAARLRRELGLVSPQLLRDRRKSFVELYATDAAGQERYGTAGYLGDGYFITVKHAVVALGQADAESTDRRMESVKLKVGRRLVRARLVDAGDADDEVHPGDWAILKVRAEVALPPLRVNLDYPYEFADPIFRLGNDYSKGVIASTGYVGERANGLVTCLTDGHPGVSGGGVLNLEGELVGIPVGRMRDDYRFSFILPLRAEMFRKVPQLRPAAPAETPTP